MSPTAYGVPCLALGRSGPAPSHLTTCDPSPLSHSTTHHAFSLLHWASPLHPGALCLAAIGHRLFTLGHYAWLPLAPPYLCPSGAPTLRSVLSRRRLPPALECVSLEGCLPFRGYAPSPSGAFAPLLPEDRGFILSPHSGFLMLAPLACRTDQALRLEAYGMWWRGSRWWIFFHILVGALQCASPYPSYLLWRLFLLTLLPAREGHFSLRLVTPCTTGMAPILSRHRGFGTSLFPHGLRPIV